MITKLICQVLLQLNSKTRPNQMLDKERTPTPSHNAQASNYMVHFGLWHTEDCMNSITKNYEWQYS